MSGGRESASPEGAFVSLSNAELAREWVRRLKAGEDNAEILREFRSRYWAREMERYHVDARAVEDFLNIVDDEARYHRPIRPDERETCGVDPFRS